MNQIDIYTTESCPFCVKAKKLFNMLKLEYTEHSVEDCFEEMCKNIGEKFGRSVSTVPQIIINGNYIGGYTDLEALYKSGGLEQYLKK